MPRPRQLPTATTKRNINMPDALWKALTKRAHALGRDASSLIREILAREVDRDR